jgi:catechol 2,3-dioxygenase-like lactoylglutathione lyase family enzyme
MHRFAVCALTVALLAAGVQARPQPPSPPSPSTTSASPSSQVQPQEAARPAIAGIAQVAFRVSAIDAAREFYGHVLGLPAMPGAAAAPAAKRGANSGACVRYQVNGRQAIVLEPGLPPDEEERLSFLAFETPSVDALAAYLTSRGITLESHGPATACAPSPAVWVKDPDGHLLAFVEPSRSRTRETGGSGSGASTARAVSARVLHAGLTIRDAEAADRFYKETLGFSEIWRGGRPDAVTSWINMKVPNGTDYLEYMLVSAPVSRQQRGVLHHVALLVPDIQVALETVTNRTIPAARAKLASPQVGRNNRWQLNLYDPDGTRVEMMEPFTMR